MWLRDSVSQVRPYLIPAKEDQEIADLLVGLVRRQMFYVNLDAYANAFNAGPDGACWEKDETQMSPWVWERKYEVDSLCYPLQLAWLIWKNTGRTDQFDEEYVKGTERILTLWETEQYHEEKSPYSFVRRNCYFTDTLSRSGKGALVKSGIGLTWSGFRPSDDACVYGYLIPSNMFASVVLERTQTVLEKVLGLPALAARAGELAGQIHAAIEREAVIHNSQYGDIYAYEVDGYGQYCLMDDANVPSLLSMKYLGYRGDRTETEENTRRFILSEANPFYYKGSAAAGIGSPHTPVNYIWHISLAMQGLTSDLRDEKLHILRLLKNTDGGKGMMHEGFHVDNPAEYTREWFSWANAMFCELMMDYCGLHVEQ